MGEEGGCWPGPSAASRAPDRKEFLVSLLPFCGNSPNLGAGVPSHPANPQQTKRLPTALIRQAKGRGKGNAVSVLLIVAFLYCRGHVGPSLSACVCRKQPGCVERDSSSFLSSPVPACGSGQRTLGSRCAGFCYSATGYIARLLEFHSRFSGRHRLWVLLWGRPLPQLTAGMGAPSCVLKLREWLCGSD